MKTSLLLPTLLLCSMYSMSADAQAACTRDSVAVMTSVFANGFGTEDANTDEENRWNNALPRLFQRCELCENRGDAMLLATAFRADSGFKVLFPPDSVEFDPKTGARIRPIGAMVAITVDILSPGRPDVDSLAVGITWQWVQNRYNKVQPPAFFIRGFELRDRERLIHRLVDQLRQASSLRCLLAAHSPTRFSWTSRVGILTGEFVTENDFGSEEDLRLQMFGLGFLVDRQLNSYTDLRLRFDATIAFPYLSATGGPVFSAVRWEQSPLIMPSLGFFAVVFPFSRRAPVYGVLGGEAVGYASKRYSFGTHPTYLENSPDTEWTASVHVPAQLDLGLTGGLGLTAPFRIEILTRWSRPRLTFLGASRSPSVFDVSAAVAF